MIKFILLNITILKLTLEIKDKNKVNMNSEEHETGINFMRIQKEGNWPWGLDT